MVIALLVGGFKDLLGISPTLRGLSLPAPIFHLPPAGPIHDEKIDLYGQHFESPTQNTLM